jgi:hypothetical protein
MSSEDPGEEFVRNYLTLIPCQSFGDFQKVLDLKVRFNKLCQFYSNFWWVLIVRFYRESSEPNRIISSTCFSHERLRWPISQILHSYHRSIWTRRRQSCRVHYLLLTLSREDCLEFLSRWCLVVRVKPIRGLPLLQLWDEVAMRLARLKLRVQVLESSVRRLHSVRDCLLGTLRVLERVSDLHRHSDYETIALSLHPLGL